VKLDNLIQIAHNVEIGENTGIAAQSGIAGSTKVGKNCLFAGQVGIAGHLTVGDNVSLGAQTGLISNIESGKKLMGTPAIDLTNYLRSSIIFSRLPEIYKAHNQLQKDIEILKREIHKVKSE
jgi:UDP-3-O-[3-hydroxymyristoyl] glucosamine N-acyltransferase